MKSHDFSGHLTEFLGHYLPEMQNVSPNTISSYCDTFRLFLEYCRDVAHLKIEKMSLSDLKPEAVDGYLAWLECERKNCIATRNQRLAAIHSFVRYVQPQVPSLLLDFQRILDIPIKKSESKPVEHLTKEEIALIFRQPDTSTQHGRRDLVLLCVLYDTAARAQELCDIRAGDVRLENPPSIRITGKGRKNRVVPLLPATAKNLKYYMEENRLLSSEKSQLPLFPNRDGCQLTRAGLRYILNKYAQQAGETAGIMTKQISPHVFRHSKAMHLYEAGNNLIYVRDFLDHADIRTTGIYARTSLLMKRQALEKITDSPSSELASWVQDKDLLTWLKNFGLQKV